jgi:hypothetical protein
MSEIDWQPCTQAEADALIKEHDLVVVYHTVADCCIWYRRAEVDACTSYMDCTPYIRKSYLYDTSPVINRTAAPRK